MEGMDLLQGVQDAGAEMHGAQLPPDMGEFKMPTLEQMMDLLAKMDISDEDRAEILEGFTNKAETLAKLAGQGANRIRDAMDGASQSTGMPMEHAARNFTVLLIAICVILMLFAFFGYKLYRSLTEKERKREEKRKMKQQKKKK